MKESPSTRIRKVPGSFTGRCSTSRMPSELNSTVCPKLARWIRVLGG